MHGAAAGARARRSSPRPSHPRRSARLRERRNLESAPLEHVPLETRPVVRAAAACVQRPRAPAEPASNSGRRTDDSSLALCVADSLLVCKGFQPTDMRLRFLNWVLLRVRAALLSAHRMRPQWRFGYRNAFGYDTERLHSKHGCGSVGLGGMMHDSFTEFVAKKSEYTSAGNLCVFGAATDTADRRSARLQVEFGQRNGHAARSCACVLPPRHPNGRGRGLLPQQAHASRRRGGGYQRTQRLHVRARLTWLAECCRLLAHIMVKAIRNEHAAARDAAQRLLSSLHDFRTDNYTVRCVADRCDAAMWTSYP
jgi:hypothetical protein